MSHRNILTFTVLFAIACSAAAQDTWQDEQWESSWVTEQDEGINVYGFVEAAIGGRFESSPYHKRLSIAEPRLQLGFDERWKDITWTVKADGWYDGFDETWHGQIRELNAQFTVFENTDIKVGRQVLTWGTGDYLFLNDMFPKDWQSFFTGRDQEYLKAPSDALRVTSYFSLFNVDFVWSPEFDPDNYINGKRISYFSPLKGALTGYDPSVTFIEPQRDEYALRLFRNHNGVEYALYGYDGFTKSPETVTEDYQPTFGRLTVVGASVRRTLGPGIINTEVAHHNSHKEADHWRALIGYEQELFTRFTGGFQAYVEKGDAQTRTVLTTRLTWRDERDDLTLSLFAFVSPNQNDGYLRPTVDYRIDDNWSFSAGFNLFFRERSDTFFGQFTENNNAYLRMRYAF
ncbi:hypothetical protein [Idiomarina sp. HP20-50]|uniref:hypothetical protein n=1 Tax=Idiomarina sp. HP20-50 TaxID=3070813 RepID=UPI00294B18F6|nr:hypothetical protein [Idiomarina sp. HP20-50]MDV6316363.1 hypothetical protein [Idiomarina sp. HP20-50]